MSHNQPWFTESLSTPRILSILFCDEFNSVEQPIGHPLQVDLVDFKSHGLALNLYEVDVRAPTGHICTVFPEKYDLNGSFGNVFTSVLLPL